MNELLSQASVIEWIASAIFALALLHTFSTRFFEHLAHTRPAHAGAWHLLGEIEVAFGFWAMVFILTLFLIDQGDFAIEYVESRNFTEPLFVFVTMVVAGTRPILIFAGKIVSLLSRIIPVHSALATYFLLLFLVPLLGSLITEPAAMTLAALMLRDTFVTKSASSKLRYLTLGGLFVNISIGGTLTHFAAPPVLMVAGTWGWDSVYMATHFGWRGALAALVNALILTFIFRNQLITLFEKKAEAEPHPFSPVVAMVHLIFLGLIVTFGHHPQLFLGIFLFFLGYSTAYHRCQSPLILKEALLVAFFLSGLVVLGGMQEWWLQPALLSMTDSQVYYGAAALSAITDNAALTYLGSLVEGLTEEFKIALVAGAVTGGGLTVVANAPNPAGVSILRENFRENSISPFGLLLAAIPPTLVAIIAFRFL